MTYVKIQDLTPGTTMTSTARIVVKDLNGEVVYSESSSTTTIKYQGTTSTETIASAGHETDAVARAATQMPTGTQVVDPLHPVLTTVPPANPAEARLIALSGYSFKLSALMLQAKVGAGVMQSQLMRVFWAKQAYTAPLRSSMKFGELIVGPAIALNSWAVVNQAKQDFTETGVIP